MHDYSLPSNGGRFGRFDAELPVTSELRLASVIRLPDGGFFKRPRHGLGRGIRGWRSVGDVNAATIFLGEGGTDDLVATIRRLKRRGIDARSEHVRLVTRRSWPVVRPLVARTESNA